MMKHLGNKRKNCCKLQHFEYPSSGSDISMGTRAVCCLIKWARPRPVGGIQGLPSCFPAIDCRWQSIEILRGRPHSSCLLIRLESSKWTQRTWCGIKEGGRWCKDESERSVCKDWGIEKEGGEKTPIFGGKFSVCHKSLFLTSKKNGGAIWLLVVENMVVCMIIIVTLYNSILTYSCSNSFYAIWPL